MKTGDPWDRGSFYEPAVFCDIDPGSELAREEGLGQQEINLRYSDALTQADRNVIYKHAAKEIAWAQGKSVTFMAKWNEKHTGSSAHIHVSLRDADGKSNVFPGDRKTGPVEASDTFRWFLGADRDRLELRQPDRRLPRRRQRPVAAHRVSHSGSGRQSLRDLCRRPRRRPRRHPQPHRATGDLPGGHLRRAGPAAGAFDALRGDHRIRAVRSSP